MPLMQGQHLNNRYWIAMLIEQGGFGAVYKAWDITLNRPVAIKEGYEESAEGQRQFLREAQILANLAHPNLPRVIDFFTIQERVQYLVMEFIEGQTLEELRTLADGRLPEAQALGWIAQVLEALSYIHRQNPPVIHRDIKPTNIKVTPADENTPQGRAVLVDFGVAKTYDSLKRTTMGARAVTPGYSPIEQYGTGVTDARTDIYALGATLYMLLTGQEPPEAPQRVVRDPLAKPRQLNPDLSPEIEAVILKAMRMDPDERFQTAGELKAAVRGLLEVEGSRQAVAGSQKPSVSSQPPVVVVEPPAQQVVEEVKGPSPQAVAQPEAVAPTPRQVQGKPGQMPATPSGTPGGVGARGGSPPSPPVGRVPAQPARRSSPWKWLGLVAGLVVGLVLVVVVASQVMQKVNDARVTQTAQAWASQTAGAALAEAADTLDPSTLPSLTTSPPLASPGSTTLLPSLTASPLAVNLTNTPSGSFEYTVQEGDSLAEIAGQFDSDIMTLLALNPAIDPILLTLNVGQKILIPAPNTQLPTATPVDTTVPPGTMITYTVLSGETLEAIAIKFRSSVRQIVEENELENANDLFAGQILKIPVNIASAVDGMVQVYIPGGTFQMGEDADRSLAECQALLEPFSDSICSREWFTNEEPVHTVTLDAFWMDETEVTNGMYAQCVAAGACSPPNETGSTTRDSYYGDAAYADYPVIYVDWNQADAYCAWAGRELPSEAQWEYAARGGLVGKLYPWGEPFDGSLANFCDANCPFSHSNPDFNDGYFDTAPVGSYPANGYGLYDMAGNVWEWVADWYGLYSSEDVDNPSGPASGSVKLLRGGTWYYDGYYLRVSYRGGNLPDDPNYSLGFRCSRSP